MANFSRRERVTRHVEYLHRRGDCVGELQKALYAAWVDYCRLRGLDVKTKREPDDWAEIDFDDDYVIIKFEVPTVNREVS